ncbi:MAG: pyridoxal-phosphate dependent enzyme [Nitrospirota bacterium]|nr:pyridoxal-phosphate dependent enzyme [Nitrospirota bacterium]
MDDVTFADIQRAAERLRGVAHVTPVCTGRQLDEASGATAFLKCENFQRVGAFKFRGAYHAILMLPPEDQGRPIVTISSGNHAQGVALACRLLGREAHILMGGLSNPIKRQAVLGYGATIHEATDHLDAERKLPALLEQLNGVYIHPFNDPLVIAGQGAVMLEFLSTVPDLDVALAPVGGGGLLSGTCLAAHGINPKLKIYACEPAGALDAMHSVRENRVMPMPEPRTLAEGLKTSLGDVTLSVLRQHLAGFFVVEEEEIPRAMRFAFERLKLVIEPSSAVALAPLLRREPALVGKRVGVILTGGNVDLTAFFEQFERKA